MSSPVKEFLTQMFPNRVLVVKILVLSIPSGDYSRRGEGMFNICRVSYITTYGITITQHNNNAVNCCGVLELLNMTEINGLLDRWNADMLEMGWVCPFLHFGIYSDAERITGQIQ